jgi:acetyl esterase/lipase
MTEIGRLWRGEKGLAFTFWIWYVFIIGFLVGSVGLFAVLFARSLTLFVSWIVMYLVLFVVGLVALWRSAGHYNGPSVWKWLARAACILGVLRVAAFPVDLAKVQSTETSNDMALAQARGGFKTKLVRQEHGDLAAPEPPFDLFRMVHYPSKLGSLAAYISVAPKDGKAHPAIIWVFGGFSNGIGETAWQPAPSDNDQSARAFREAGIITMYPSFRGGNDNPGFREGLFGEVDDVIAAGRFLRHQDGVDPERIYLGGHSTGGTLVMLVAESTDQFRATFAFGPVHDVRAYGADELPFDANDPNEGRLRAPILWLAGIKSPTFVFEGESQPCNIKAMNALANAEHSPQIHLYGVRGVNHFSIMAKVTPLIAKQIAADIGPDANIRFGVDRDM